MITAEQFARQNAVWHRSTPTLEQFTRWANKNGRYTGGPVVKSPGTRSSLVAEVAYLNATGMSPGRAFEEARRRLRDLPRAPDLGPNLTVWESFEVGRLVENSKTFLSVWGIEEPMWAPSFPGCGRVLKASGDLLAAGHLVEVKSVLRLLRGVDFRQALTYAALAYSVGRSIDRISLLNPRLGVYFSSPAEDLALDIGSGSWVGLMQDLVEAMSDEGVSR